MQNRNLKNKQNHATKVNKIQKKRSYENDMSRSRHEPDISFKEGPCKM